MTALAFYNSAIDILTYLVRERNMSSSNIFRSQSGNGFGGSTNRASTPTNFTGLLARSEALGVNDVSQDRGDTSELPRIHYGIGEIERQSEVAAGKGKRKALRGEG
jgi:hypothetical protein